MTETGRQETREWSYPGSAEIHTIFWDGLLPPPDGTPHVPWCQGCRIEALLAVVEAAPKREKVLREMLLDRAVPEWEIDEALALHSQASDEGKPE